MPHPQPPPDRPPLTCPDGRPCRLTLVNQHEGLVYCVPGDQRVCPHVLAFEGTRYCRAFLHSKPRESPPRGSPA